MKEIDGLGDLLGRSDGRAECRGNRAAAEEEKK